MGTILLWRIVWQLLWGSLHASLIIVLTTTKEFHALSMSSVVPSVFMACKFTKQVQQNLTCLGITIVVTGAMVGAGQTCSTSNKPRRRWQ